MIVRPLQPGDAAAVSRLNPWPPAWQAYLEAAYAFATPQNVLVAVEDEQPVGVLHILDAGLPWTILDGFYLAPGFRSLKRALQLGRAAEDELRRRGVALYMVNAPTRLGRVLQHFGLKPFGGADFMLLGQVLTPQESPRVEL